MYSKLTFLIFSLIYLVKASDDSDEGRYIDLLPEDEKRAFIERIARRILDEVETTGEKHKSGEISDAQLDQHSEYVARLLKEERENMRRRMNITKSDDLKTDDNVPVDKSVKEQELDLKKDKVIEEDDNKSLESKKEKEGHNVGDNDKLDSDNIDFTLREGELKIVHNKEIISTTAKMDNVKETTVNEEVNKSVLGKESRPIDDPAMEKNTYNNTKLHDGHKHLDVTKNQTNKDPVSIEITIYDKTEEDLESSGDNKASKTNISINTSMNQSEIPVAVIMDTVEESSKNVARTDADFLSNNSNETSKYPKNDRFDSFDDTRKFLDNLTNSGVEPKAVQKIITNTEPQNNGSLNLDELKISRRNGIDETTKKENETQTEKARTVKKSKKSRKSSKKAKIKRRHAKKVKVKSSSEKAVQNNDLTTENTEEINKQEKTKKESTIKTPLDVEKYDDVNTVKSTDKVNVDEVTSEATTLKNVTIANADEIKEDSNNTRMENKDELEKYKTPPIKRDDLDITIEKHKRVKTKKKHAKKSRAGEKSTEKNKEDGIDGLSKTANETILVDKEDEKPIKILRNNIDEVTAEKAKTDIPEIVFGVKRDDHDIKLEKSNTIKTKNKHVKTKKVKVKKGNYTTTENTEKFNTENEIKNTEDKEIVKVQRSDTSNLAAETDSHKLMEVTKMREDDIKDVENENNEPITKSEFVKFITTAKSVQEKSEEVTPIVKEDPANSTQVDEPKDETKTILKENNKYEAKENLQVTNKLVNSKEIDTISTSDVNPVNAPGTFTTSTTIRKDTTISTEPKPIELPKEINEPVKFITEVNKVNLPNLLRQNNDYILTTAKALPKKTIAKQTIVEQSNSTVKKSFMIQNEAETQIENSQKFYDLKTKYEKENKIKEEYFVYEIPSGKSPFVNGKVSIPPEMLKKPIKIRTFRPEKFKVLSGKPIARTGNIDDIQLDNEKNNFKPVYYSAKDNTFHERLELQGMPEKSVRKESKRMKNYKTEVNKVANYVPVYSYSPDNAYFNPNDRFGEQPEGLEKPVDRNGDRDEDGISNTAEKNLVPVYNYAPSNAYFDPSDKFVDLNDVVEMDASEKSVERQGFDEDYFYRSVEGSNDYPSGNILYEQGDKLFFKPKHQKEADYELDDNIRHKKDYDKLEDDNPYYHIPKTNFKSKKVNFYENNLFDLLNEVKSNRDENPYYFPKNQMDDYNPYYDTSKINIKPDNAEEDYLYDLFNDRHGPVKLVNRDDNPYYHLPKDKMDDDNPYYHIPKINFLSEKVNAEEHDLNDLLNAKKGFDSLERDDNPYYHVPKDKMDDDNPYYHIPKVNFNPKNEPFYSLNRDDNPYYHFPKDYQSRYSSGKMVDKSNYNDGDNTYHPPKYQYERTKTDYFSENDISKKDEINAIRAKIKNNNHGPPSHSILNKEQVPKVNLLNTIQSKLVFEGINDPQPERVFIKDHLNVKGSKANQNDYPYSGIQNRLKNQLSALRQQILSKNLGVPQFSIKRPRKDEFKLKIEDVIKPLNPDNVIINEERNSISKKVVTQVTEEDDYDIFESYSKEDSLRKQYTEESAEEIQKKNEAHEFGDIEHYEAVANISDSRDVVPALIKLQSVLSQKPRQRSRNDEGGSWWSSIFFTKDGYRRLADKTVNMDSLPSGSKNRRTPLQSRDSLLDAYLSVMEDMIRNDASALYQYDWLATAVEVQAALKKCIDLTKRLQLGEDINPADLELLYYVVYLFQISKDDLAKYRSDRGLYVATDIQKGTEFIDNLDKKLVLSDLDQNVKGVLNHLDYSLLDVKQKLNEDRNPKKTMSYLKHLSNELKNLKAAFEGFRTPKKRREKLKNFPSYFNTDKRNNINRLMQYINDNKKGIKFKFYSVKSDSKNKDFSDLLQLSKRNKHYRDSTSITYEELLDLIHDEDSKARDLDNLVKLGLAGTFNQLKDTLWPNDRSAFKAKKIFKSLLKNRNPNYRRLINDVSPLVEMFLQPTQDHFEDKLKEFEKFLYDVQDGLDDFHDAIKHVTMVSKRGRQLFPNIRELYLSGSSRKQAAEVLLHLTAARLVGLVNSSTRDGLPEDYQKYIEGHQEQVERTKEEFVFVLRLLEELRINK